jgi:hypothetical protein
MIVRKRQGLVITAGLLTAAGSLGLRMRPAPFPAYPEESGPAETVPLPAGLPAPVERFYRTAYGERIPVVRTVVVTGRGRLRPFGLWLPARFRFTHDAGRGYRHYIECTWLGLPFFKVNERYVDGRSLMELPWGKDEGPKVEQAANIGMWAELSSAAPAVLLTDPRVRWQAVDDETSIMSVPFGERGRDAFIVRFDAATGRIASMEAMRYRDSRSEQKVLWIAASQGDRLIGTKATVAGGTATWLDQGRAWARFEAEDIRVNVDVDLRARGL